MICVFNKKLVFIPPIQNYSVFNKDYSQSSSLIVSKPFAFLDSKTSTTNIKKVGDTDSKYCIMQQKVKSLAESFGFKAAVEEPGRIDVGLSRDSLKIAIDISVTNSVDYEINNILKCLDSGYQLVIMCCEINSHLKKIEEKARLNLSIEHHSKIRFLKSIDLASFFNQIQKENEYNNLNIIKGYRVKVNYI